MQTSPKLRTIHHDRLITYAHHSSDVCIYIYIYIKILIYIYIYIYICMYLLVLALHHPHQSSPSCPPLWKWGSALRYSFLKTYWLLQPTSPGQLVMMSFQCLGRAQETSGDTIRKFLTACLAPWPAPQHTATHCQGQSASRCSCNLMGGFHWQKNWV